MREILFRGKCIDNNEWIYGGFVKVSPPPVVFKGEEEPTSYYIVCENPRWENDL